MDHNLLFFLFLLIQTKPIYFNIICSEIISTDIKSPLFGYINDVPINFTKWTILIIEVSPKKAHKRT